MAHLYCANPNMSPAALGMFSPATQAQYVPKGPTMGLRRTQRPDLAVATSGAAFGGVRGGGLRGFGDWFTDAVGSITGGVTGIVDSVTGRGAARDQAQAATDYAALQTQARIAEANASAAGWSNVAVPVGLALAAALGLGLVVALRR